MKQAVGEVSASELGQLYLELHHRFHRMIDEAMCAAGVSLSRAKMLKELAEYGPMNQSTLATRLGFAPRSITDSVDALERDGLAIRTGDPHDRRARIVEMTPAGGTALASALAAKRATMDQIFGALDAPARAEFAALLSSLTTRFTSLPGENCVE